MIRPTMFWMAVLPALAGLALAGEAAPRRAPQARTEAPAGAVAAPARPPAAAPPARSRPVTPATDVWPHDRRTGGM